jgi:hypothetical protein
MRQLGELRRDVGQHPGESDPALDGGTVDLGPPAQPLGLHPQMALAPPQLLSPVLPTATPHPGRLDRVARPERGTRLRVASCLLTHRLPQGGLP